MNKIKEKIINLFANHSLAEIDKDKGKLIVSSVVNYRQLAEDTHFNSLLGTLKELRRELDQVLEGEKGIQQVKECLFWLNEKKREAKRKKDNEGYCELCKELIKRGIYQKEWNEDQQHYFDAGIKMITDWKDFFISYTNRNLHDTNDDFKGIITAALGKTFYKENKDISNCLPHLVVHFLNLEGLRGFFDKHNMTCGDIIKDKVFEYCTSVYTFIQLLEIAAFTYRENEDNWCYLEFEKFYQWTAQTDLKKCKRSYFILTGEKEEIFPTVLNESFEDWKNKIEERKYISNLKALSKEKLRKELKKLAKEIINTKKKVIEDYYS